jgi:hypothetical protein
LIIWFLLAVGQVVKMRVVVVVQVDIEQHHLYHLLAA